MIKVKFNPPRRNANWVAWVKEAELETQKNMRLARLRKRIVYKPKLYKKMRQVIFDSFNGKCAYCEAKFILTETGDVEHYRPKGSVTDENDRKVMIKVQGKPVRAHPGYYWLAYDWHNLLPSCSLCNRPSRPRGTLLIGKGMRFPVLPNPNLTYGHARNPSDLDKELPVFIHPVLESPFKHLYFDPATGLLIDKTKRGKLCIDLLGLNREGLPPERKKIYLAVIAFLKAAIDDIENSDLPSLRNNLSIIDSYQKGKEPYSCAGQRALKDRQDLMTHLESFRRML